MAPLASRFNGQRAMAVAMVYPEPYDRGSAKSLKNSNIDGGYISRARTDEDAGGLDQMDIAHKIRDSWHLSMRRFKSTDDLGKLNVRKKDKSPPATKSSPPGEAFQPNFLVYKTSAGPGLKNSHRR